MAKVVRDFSRPPAEIINKFLPLGVSTVYEGMGKVGLMDPEIKPIDWGMKIAGPALTVFLPKGDNLMEHKALTFAKPGDVLVVAMEGLTGATWGEVIANQGMHLGLGGVVTDGYVRDVEFLRKVKFPTFARGISSLGSTKGEPGSINVEVKCGGVQVRPGDLILGDDDGVVVVPKDKLEFALDSAQKRALREKEIIDSIKKGKTTMELMGFQDTYSQLKGVELEDEATT